MSRAPVPFWLYAFNLTLLCGVLALGLWIWSLPIHNLPRTQLDALQLVHQQIVDQHVVPPSDDDLMWAAIEGMVDSVDEYSEFVRPELADEFDDETRGTYAGIGILMAYADGELVVRFPFADGPSEAAGIGVGDRILEVNGEALVGEDENALFDHAQERLRGPTGTSVRVQVRDHDTNELREVEIERRDVKLPSIKWARMLDEERGIGYIYVKGFQERTTEELFAQIDRLELIAPNGLRALILDLRFNQGGLLDEAIAMVNHFVPSGTIVSLERRNEEPEVHEADPEKCVRPDLPLVLLVNEISASASEVVTGALQDHERGTVIGTQTWGKGLVQSIFSWQGLDFRLKLTTAHYKTPKGRQFVRREDRSGGIVPDREVPLPEGNLNRLFSPLQREHEPPERYRTQERALCAELGITPAAPPGAEEDAQLAAALEEATNLLAGAGR